MTLNNLMTPFERRRVIEYGKDGNKVVRHWYDVQHVIGSLYKSKDFPNDWGELEFKLFVFFDGKCDGLRFEWLSHPECYTVERVADTMCRCRVDSMTHMTRCCMSEFTMDRLRENLEALKMKNTLEILDNYLERAVADKLNIVEVLDHIFLEAV